MQTVSDAPKPSTKTKVIRQKSKKVSYAPVILAGLLVAAFFGALSFVVATDDLAQVVNWLGVGGWGIAGVGVLLLLIVLARRFQPFLGLGIASSVFLLVLGVAVVYAAPIFSGPAHYSQGQVAYSNTDYERAINEFKLAGNSEYLRREIPEAYFKWGEKLLKTGEYEKALGQFEKVISSEYSPNAYETRVPDARAKVYLSWAEKLDKESSRAWLTYNDAQKNQVDTQLIEKYDAALALVPNATLANQAKSGARNILYRRTEDFKAQSNFEELENVYQKVIARYLDGKSQTLSEVELRRAYNFLDWGRKQVATTDFNNANEATQIIRLFKDAETRLQRYDPQRVNTVIPDIINSYTKLGPALINAGRFDEAITELSGAVRDYGQKDGKNLIGKALFNSYVEYGKDLEIRLSLEPAKTNFKQAFDLNDKYKFNDTRGREGLGRIYIKQGEEAEQATDFKKAIDIYRDGQKQKYFSPAETTTSTNFISRSYLNWGSLQASRELTDTDKALAIYREAIQNNSFIPADRVKAVDAGGDYFIKRASEAEQKNDLQQAVNLYISLSSDPLFNSSLSARNLVNIAPKTNFALAERYIAEGKATQPLNVSRINDARYLLELTVKNYGSSEFATRAKDMLQAPVEVSGKVSNNQGLPLGSRAMQVSTDWKVCTATTPDDDADCKGKKDGLVAKGEVLGFTSAPDGGWTVYLKPGQTYLVSWQEKGVFTSSFVGTQAQSTVLIKTEPLIPVKYEYKTLTDAPQ